MKNEMYCFQCQETAKNIACTKVGVCGKKASTATLQDMLIYVTKGYSEVLQQAILEHIDISDSMYDIVSFNLFMTITNANFDDSKIRKQIDDTLEIKCTVFKKLKNTALNECALWNYQEEIELERKASDTSILASLDEDIRSLKELIVYGLKGIAAYNKHAHALNKRNIEIDQFIVSTLTKVNDSSLTIEDLVPLTLQTGEYGVKVMQLLDEANTQTYGHPEVTKVNIGVKNRPAILVSGHDLKDLETLLKQSENSGVDIYTHGEMLPAHYYPAFKKYPHFVGNYGNAWWQQKEEFEAFNGPILLTTNCLVPPKASYKDRVYTTGAVGFEDCPHINVDDTKNKDFTVIIEHAKTCLPPKEIETGEIIGGFAHAQVFAYANKIIAAIKAGDIKKFIVMAGCDGRHNSRNYYEDFAKKLPKDTIILTAGCAKYRYNKLNLGDINGIPRVLDAGQCNDSYSLAIIALKLKEILGLEDINDLPIVYNIAWYEQKAVTVLLALLYLGVKNIHLGPTLPAFLSPNITQFLVDTFQLSPINDVEQDIATLL